ncbi:hypothetical protein EsH8_I_000751 [Colletotrichum jinshuiense]
MRPARPTARCCRAVQQQIRAPSDNVWITEGVLASAFERYCHVSRLARRKSSSLPGPLESRRRLGKRKITDLHMDNQSTLPPWAIDFPVDLSQWKWQPPTLRSPVEERELQSQQSHSVLSWIPRWRTDEIRLKEEDFDQTREGQSASMATFNKQLSQARAAVAASTLDAIDPSYYHFIGGLQQDLKLGTLDTEAVEMAVSTFPQSLIDTGADCEVTNAAIEMFLSAVVNGIASSKVLGPAEFNSGFWNLVLNRVSLLPANDATALLFQTTLDAVPRQYDVQDIQEGIVAAVQTLALSQSSGRRRAADIGAALRHISPINHGALLSAIEAAIYEGSAAFEEEARQKTRFFWLQVLSHMPEVDQTYLFDACARSAYFDRDLPWLFGRDLCHLLIQQWTSRGYVHHCEDLEAVWARDSSGHAHLGLAALVINLCRIEAPGFRDGHHVALNMSILKVLRRVGREEELMTSIQSFLEANKRLPIRPFKHLAMASCEHRMALRILCLLRNNAGSLEGNTYRWWTWTAWLPYVEAMIMDESVDTHTIWEVVDSGVTRDFRNPTKREPLLKQRVKLMENMAVWFSQAHHLTDRVAFRHVSRCIAWLESHDVVVSRRAVATIVSVATRDLKRGEPGRTRRLNFILDIIDRYQGPEERQAAARMLRQWREANVELGARRQSEL